MSGLSTPCSVMFIEPMRSMVPSKSKPWNIPSWKWSRRLVVVEQLRMVVAQIFAGRDQEAAGAAGGIADDVLRRRRHHLHHQRDDVARRAELAVLAGSRDLAEHVFVEVALGVAILHRDLGQQVDHLGEQRRGGDGEARALHVGRVRGAVLRHGAQEGEDVLGDDLEHRRRDPGSSAATSACPRRRGRRPCRCRPCPPERCAAPSACRAGSPCSPRGYAPRPARA